MAPIDDQLAKYQPQPIAKILLQSEWDEYQREVDDLKASQKRLQLAVIHLVDFMRRYLSDRAFERASHEVRKKAPLERSDLPEGEVWVE